MSQVRYFDSRTSNYTKLTTSLYWIWIWIIYQITSFSREGVRNSPKLCYINYEHPYESCNWEISKDTQYQYLKVFDRRINLIYGLLKRVNCSNFKVNFQKIFLFFLWVNLCLKVGDNDLNQSCNSVTILRVQNPVQIGFIRLLLL